MSTLHRKLTLYLHYFSLARERPHMILGVFVRDVDSGNAEREPIDDPTGWRVIGAAGSRPSENPLIPIDEGDNTGMDRTNIRSSPDPSPQVGMNFMSNAHLEFLEEGEEGNNTITDQTPRPNRYAFQGEGNLLVEDKSSAEPESLITDSGGCSKVSKRTSTSNIRSQTYPLEKSHRLYQQMEKPFPPPPPPPSPQNKYVTQPPKPIQPPRITVNMVPESYPSLSSQSLPYQKYVRQDSLSTSVSDSATTSSSYNNLNYGGANGGKMTEVEKKRYELQTRVNRARTQMPSHVVLRVFREPSECVEIEGMLEGLG